VNAGDSGGEDRPDNIHNPASRTVLNGQDGDSNELKKANMEKQNTAFPAAAEAALLQGNKIEAIKIVRKERGVDLKEAKDIVEQHVAARPGLQMQMESAQAASRQGFLPWLMAVIVIGALVYYFVAGR